MHSILGVLLTVFARINRYHVSDLIRDLREGKSFAWIIVGLVVAVLFFAVFYKRITGTSLTQRRDQKIARRKRDRLNSQRDE